MSLTKKIIEEKGIDSCISSLEEIANKKELRKDYKILKKYIKGVIKNRRACQQYLSELKDVYDPLKESLQV